MSGRASVAPIAPTQIGAPPSAGQAHTWTADTVGATAGGAALTSIAQPRSVTGWRTAPPAGTSICVTGIVCSRVSGCPPTRSAPRCGAVAGASVKPSVIDPCPDGPLLKDRPGSSLASTVQAHDGAASIVNVPVPP